MSSYLLLLYIEFQKPGVLIVSRLDKTGSRSFGTAEWGAQGSQSGLSNRASNSHLGVLGMNFTFIFLDAAIKENRNKLMTFSSSS